MSYTLSIPSECFALGTITFLYLCVQVPLTGLQSRHVHCAAAFTLSPGIADMVLFGGCTACPPTIETFIAETTVLRFGKHTQLIKHIGLVPN